MKGVFGVSKAYPIETSSLLASLYYCLQTVGWWTYEYCHGKVIRQYHMEGTLLIIVWVCVYCGSLVINLNFLLQFL